MYVDEKFALCLLTCSAMQSALPLILLLLAPTISHGVETGTRAGHQMLPLDEKSCRVAPVQKL